MDNYYTTNRPGRKLNKKTVNDKIKPLVTIVTPFYNAGTFFEETRIICIRIKV